MAANSQPQVELAKYRAKRTAGQTPEPFGSEAAARPGFFCVQQHDATRMHFDFRIELGGTLKSWAVPKGPSLDPREKRMAVHVEDHPVEYGDFEGIIPKGNYGAGAVILWDRGRWVAVEDPVAGMEKGKLLFELHGHKLHGIWTLVRTKRSAKDWLLIKHKDGFSRPEDPNAFPAESVLSNLTVEQLRDGHRPAEAICAELEKRRAPRKPVKPSAVELMLAETGEKPFSSAQWLFELKYDGFRLLAAAEEGKPKLRLRRGRDATALFPELALALAKLPYARLCLDGEVVILDDDGRPNFRRMLKRAQVTRPADLDRATVESPAVFFAFDLLGVNDFDLRGLPLVFRKELLRKVLPRAGPLRFSDHVLERGEELFAQVERMGLEGVMAKKADSVYRGGRWSQWLKIPTSKSGDFVVVGFTPPEGSRAGFSGLQLAAYSGGTLRYAGSVGSGFSDALLVETRARLEPLRRPKPACAGEIPRQKGQVWVDPTVVCEVRYKEWPAEGLLRAPVFVRFRDDKAPAECQRAEPHRDLPEPPAPARAKAGDDHKVSLSNLDKVFWPEDGFTKGDLINYYREISPWLLPYLKDRPVMLTRFPDGILGKSFFQKDAPEWTPPWVRREKMWSDDNQREIDQFVCDDLDTLIYLVNQGTIPLHLWSSRVTTLAHPDWCIIDLDPKKAPFAHVVKLANALRRLADQIELPAFIKTTGSSGLHVLFPLGRQVTHAQSTTLAELIARVVAQEHPEIATIARAVGDRGGRVYLDYLQNGHGKLLAGPFCVRPLPGAPVAMPLEWREVNAKLHPQKFNARNAVARMEKRKKDPLVEVLELKPRLPRALELLSERLAQG